MRGTGKSVRGLWLFFQGVAIVIVIFMALHMHFPETMQTITGYRLSTAAELEAADARDRAD